MFNEFKAEMQEALQDFKREMKDYIRLEILAGIINLQKEESQMNMIDMLDEMIANNQVIYFDILEYAVGQTDGTVLATTLNRLTASCEYAPGPELHDVCRIYCKDTIEATQRLIKQLEAGEYVHMVDGFEACDD